MFENNESMFSCSYPEAAPRSKDGYRRDLVTKCNGPADETLAAAALASMNGGVDSDENETETEVESDDGSGDMPGPVHAPPVNWMMVDHTYTDYSVIDEDDLALLARFEEDSSSSGALSKFPLSARKDCEKQLKKLKRLLGDLGPTRKNSGGVLQPFPEKLMEVLERNDLEHIISWMPHGRSFLVKLPKLFVQEILPRFFKQSKFMSFTRQLNLWGFKRLTGGRDAGAYYHELFLRGRPRLCMRMRRQKIKGTGIKLTPNPETEPNFYDFSKIRPLSLPENKIDFRPLPPLPSTYPSFSHTDRIVEVNNTVPVYISSPRDSRSIPSLGTTFVNRDDMPYERVRPFQDALSISESRMYTAKNVASLINSNSTRGHSQGPPPARLRSSYPLQPSSAHVPAPSFPYGAASFPRQSRMEQTPTNHQSSVSSLDQRLSAAILRHRIEYEHQEQALLSAQGLLRNLDPVGVSIDELKGRLINAVRTLEMFGSQIDPSFCQTSGFALPTNSHAFLSQHPRDVVRDIPSNKP